MSIIYMHDQFNDNDIEKAKHLNSLPPDENGIEYSIVINSECYRSHDDKKIYKKAVE